MVATSWALSDTARTRRVIDRVRSNAISAARRRATSVIPMRMNVTCCSASASASASVTMCSASWSRMRGDARDGLVELGRVERHERAPVGGDDDAVEAVHGVVQAS